MLSALHHRRREDVGRAARRLEPKPAVLEREMRAASARTFGVMPAGGRRPVSPRPRARARRVPREPFPPFSIQTLPFRVGRARDSSLSRRGEGRVPS